MPVDYTNDVHVIAGIDNFISINNAVDVDLYGQVNAESAGTKQISGTGGQLDFVMGAYLSKGGKSFICLSSTFKQKDGTVASRIRPTLANGSIATDTRTSVHYIVTEYGMVNLKGKSAWQRAEDLISVAHPDFREQLIGEDAHLEAFEQALNKRNAKQPPKPGGCFLHRKLALRKMQKLTLFKRSRNGYNNFIETKVKEGVPLWQTTRPEPLSRPRCLLR